jgi:uncharacterized protein (UPF0335 family)
MARRLVDEVGPKRGRGRPRKDNGSDTGPVSVIENGRLGDNAAKRLAGFVEEIEGAEEVRRDLSEKIKEIYKAAKDAGFENKIIRKVIAVRRRDADDLQAEQDMIDIYKQALGMLSDLPLGQAAIVRNVPTRAAEALRAASQAHLEGDLPPIA